MMKRWIAGLAVAGLLTAGGTALACGHGQRLNYVDANNDGVCDNRVTSVCWNDANGDGICDNRASGVCYCDTDGDGVCDRCGKNYVDANGDGICDNCNSVGSYAHHGYGHGHGCHK